MVRDRARGRVRGRHAQRLRSHTGERVAAGRGEQTALARGVRVSGRRARGTGRDAERDGLQALLGEVTAAIAVGVIVRGEAHDAARARRVGERARDRGVGDGDVERVRRAVRAVAHARCVPHRVRARGRAEQEVAARRGVRGEVAHAHQRAGDAGIGTVLDAIEVEVLVHVARDGVGLGAEVRDTARRIDIARERDARVRALVIGTHRGRGHVEGDALDVGELCGGHGAVRPVPRRGRTAQVHGEQRLRAGRGARDQRHALARATVVVRHVARAVAVHLAQQDHVVRIRRRGRIGALGRTEIARIHHAVVVGVERVADELGPGAVADRRRPCAAVERLGPGRRGRIVGERRDRAGAIVRERQLVLGQDDLVLAHVCDGRLRHRVVAIGPVTRRTDVARHEVERGTRGLVGLEPLRRPLLLVRGRHQHHRDRDRDHGEHGQRHEQLDERETRRGVRATHHHTTIRASHAHRLTYVVAVTERAPPAAPV